MAEPILFQVDGAIATVTLNRPAARNAINAELNDAMTAAFDRIEADDDIRIAILAASGPAFSAGLDLRAFSEGKAGAILDGPFGFGGLARRMRKKPLIAAVAGPALAGGFELALACDMIVAGPGARFGLPEPQRGLIAGAGGVFRLAARIPQARAAEILLSARAFDRDEAMELGLISLASADDPLPDARAMAHRIVANAPLSVTATLALLNAARNRDEAELWRRNDSIFAPVAASADAKEGALAFAEKRPARWRGC